jgi:serine O-acetyltransferase
MLISLLVADLERQLQLCGSKRRASWITVFVRLLHPRFLPNVLLRISRSALEAGIPGLPSACTYLNIILFGIEVSPRCQIGPGLFLPHTSGTVIGAWRIGKNVTVFQNVTIGAKKIDMGFDHALRPEVEDGVTLGAGSKILGGIRIGQNAVVGANSVLLESIPPDSMAVGIPATVVRGKSLIDSAREPRPDAKSGG